MLDKIWSKTLKYITFKATLTRDQGMQKIANKISKTSDLVRYYILSGYL